MRNQTLGVIMGLSRATKTEGAHAALAHAVFSNSAQRNGLCEIHPRLRWQESAACFQAFPAASAWSLALAPSIFTCDRSLHPRQ